MRSRSRSVRFKVVSLLLLPLCALTAVWAFATSVTVSEGLDLLHRNALDTGLGGPTGSLITALQQERRLSLVYVGSGGTAGRAEMDAQRTRTDEAASKLRGSAGSDDVRGAASAALRQRIDEMLARLDDLDAVRRSIDGGGADIQRTLDAFTGIIDSASRVHESVSVEGGQDAPEETRALVGTARAREALSREDAFVAGVLAAGRFTSSEYRRFAQLMGARRFLHADAVAALSADGRARYQQHTAAFDRVRTLEDRVVGGRQVDAGKWEKATQAAVTAFGDLEPGSTGGATRGGEHPVTGFILRLALVVGLGLLVIVASIIIAVRIARTVIGDIRGMTAGVYDFAHRRLPMIADKLRRDEKVESDVDMPTYNFTTTDVLELLQAFIVARDATVKATADEAMLRNGINEVFVNLARRSQALVHRQLNLLDAMERRATEPEELEDLFRLDHLTTRMRRHAEGLVILSGAAPGRGWRNPVRFVDVVRGAVAEVEDYARVTVLSMPNVALAGPAVADVIHLIAELVENATLFSPPHTHARVSGQLVANGFVVEVEDRGLGMSAEELDAANEILQNPPEFDLSYSAQLGLFVVSQLAKRHGIKVSLRTSPYGGITAIVLIPRDIVVQDEDAGAQATRSVRAPRDPEDQPPALPAESTGAGTTGSLDPGLVEKVRLYREGRSDQASRALPDQRTGTALQARSEPSPELTPSLRLAKAGTRPEQPQDAAPPPSFEQAAQEASEQKASEDGDAGVDLPRRVRQANLAPQLRDDPRSLEDERGGDVDNDRSPEEIRTMMTSIQEGWLRGRSDAEQAVEGEDS